ncbi:hypothetical protein COO60DRAFT_802973 [Scenedesmus sp. NREL 46B-D3]|nr:hypothetical protein COO60DRAFT_802973 [Scenedesmus sp. NREL 46B-D3]
MDESRKAQLLLERSLRDRKQQLQQKTQEWQGKEQALFTKFAMLLNKKTERIQALTNTVQEQARQLEQLQGEEAHSTDDEALAGVYNADTEDDEPDEPAQLQGDVHQQQQMQQQQQQQQPLLLKQEELPSNQQSLQQPLQQLPPASEAATGAAAKPGSHEAAAVDAMDLDQATQLLDDDAQGALELQRQQHLLKQQQVNGTSPGAAPQEAAQHVGAGGGAATGLAAPAAGAAGDSSRGGAHQRVQQHMQGGPAEDVQRKPKAFKRRR